MGLSSSLYTGLTGMKSNEFSMDVIGNNIANVNTYGFKSSRASFQNQFLHTFSFGTAPSGTIGGTNPTQVGTGSTVGGVARDWAEGAPETTGRKTDLAIQGQGMFVMKKSDGTEVYSRDGSLQFNAENYLMSADGYFLQGYAVDQNFNIVEGTLDKLRIPLGEITTATATGNAKFSGDLNGNGVSATNRSVNTSQTLYSVPGLGAGNEAAAGTLLTSLYKDDGSGAGVQLFNVDNVISSSAVDKGGAILESEDFLVTATSTLGDLAAWLEDVIGINTDADLPVLAGVDDPGVSIVNGQIKIVGNIGSRNNLTLLDGAITAAQGAGLVAPQTNPFTFINNVSAESDFTAMGESIRTSFRGYDSLGNPLDVNLTMAMQEKDSTGITWRFFIESADDTDADRVLGTGTIKFDNQGNYLEGTNLAVSVDRENLGSSTPQSIVFDFTDLQGYAMNSAMSLLSQDGFQAGTLQDYAIGPDGIITGSFTNGLTRTLGQVVVATFRNYGGLVADSNNAFLTGPNSGDAIVKKPLELGAGAINSTALELSNVDLSREFINLIVTSTGFSASSRVIQTSDQLLSELMAMTR